MKRRTKERGIDEQRWDGGWVKMAMSRTGKGVMVDGMEVQCVGRKRNMHSALNKGFKANPINACVCERVQAIVGHGEWRFRNTIFCNGSWIRGATCFDNGGLASATKLYGPRWIITIQYF
ncbi:hypothetical protein VNO78_27148 [Psophocarpus tetragonolobus]|uniref:Uncharacterized protein n=1 Tax=Psophocarpus tetragonolobus TaxID=3891 RepID=A0AAN9S0U3_PSOTE